MESLHQLNDYYLDEEIVLCGGKRIYEEGAKVFNITEFSITEIEGDYTCDTFLDFSGCRSDMKFATSFPLCDNSPHTIIIYYNEVN
jgi:dihydrofolate reductase